MTISRLARLLCMVAMFYPPAFSAASDDLSPPADYIQTKLQKNVNLELVRSRKSIRNSKEIKWKGRL